MTHQSDEAFDVPGVDGEGTEVELLGRLAPAQTLLQLPLLSFSHPSLIHPSYKHVRINIIFSIYYYSSYYYFLFIIIIIIIIIFIIFILPSYHVEEDMRHGVEGRRFLHARPC